MAKFILAMIAAALGWTLFKLAMARVRPRPQTEETRRLKRHLDIILWAPAALIMAGGLYMLATTLYARFFTP